MTVKQLHEILGKFIEAGAGEWDVLSLKRQEFKTTEEHREWLKSKLPPKPMPSFDVGEVSYFAVEEEDGVDHGRNIVGVLPSLLNGKEKNIAFYRLPSVDFMKGNRNAPPTRLFEMVAKE